jgi:hypothetical protein
MWQNNEQRNNIWLSNNFILVGFVCLGGYPNQAFIVFIPSGQQQYGVGIYVPRA